MILRDIKKDMESGESTGETATADMIRKIQAELADKLREDISVDDMAAAVTAAVEKTVPLDEDSAAQLQRLAKQLMEQAGE